MRAATDIQLWLAAGVRTPFARSDGPLAEFDAIQLSVIVVQNMMGRLRGVLPDLAVWGAVVPNLAWSNIAREVLMDAGAPATIPAFSTVMACSTSMIAAIEAAGMINGTNRNLALVGGVDVLSKVPLGLAPPLSDWIVKFRHLRSLGQKLAHLVAFRPRDLRIYIPRIVNRTSGLSMGEHTEITAKKWGIAREDQDRLALESHQSAVRGWESGFFDDIVIPVGKLTRDTIPRKDTSLEKLARLPPAFDKTSGKGSLTAGNSSPLTDGAAALWVGSEFRRSETAPRDPKSETDRLGNRLGRFQDGRPLDGASLRRAPSSCPQQSDICGYPTVGDPRGFQRPGPVPHQSLGKRRLRQREGRRQGVARRFPARAHEPQRWQCGARPPLRGNRSAHPEPGGKGARREILRRLRDRQHMCRWRPGVGRSS